MAARVPPKPLEVSPRSLVLSQVGEPGEVLEKGQSHLAGWAVAVLNHDDLRRAGVGRIGVVGVVAVDEADNVTSGRDGPSRT